MHTVDAVIINESESKMTPWLVCFSAALFFFYEFIQGNMFATISQDIMHDFAIKADKLGFMSSIYYVANVLFLFPAGIILDRFSTKKIILFAMVLCVSGTLFFAMVHQFYWALFCRFITGIGSAFCFLSCIRLASRWFPPQRMALITGLIVTMAMTGGMVAQSPLTNLVQSLGWRQAVLIDGILGIVFLVMIAKFVKDYPAGQEAIELEHKQKLATMGFWTSLKTAYFNTQNILAGLYTSLMNMPVAIIGAMIGSMYLMQAEHMTRSDASMAVMMIFIGTIIGGPIVGWLSDKIQLRRGPMLIGNIMSMIIVLLIIYAPVFNYQHWLILFFLLGFFTSAQVISYPLVAENSPLSLTATSVSVVSIITQGGFILYQNLFAYLLHMHWDNTMNKGVPLYAPDNYHFALGIIPIGFVIAFFALLKITETYCKRHESRS
jgi:MFS family permease